jgi:hypothetical protein
MDELTLKGVVIGLTNKIHILSLTPADKELFEKLDELPMCIEYRVEPGVNLTKVPIINNKAYKTDQCPICLENLFTIERGGPVVGIGLEGCGHKFHRDCLSSSLLKNNKCPMCRRPISGYIPLAIDRAEGESGGRRKRRKMKKTKKSNKRGKIRKSKKSTKLRHMT